ncbi:hypothetical protein QQG73_15330 [Listeria monocytogenes]|nr:hypothetical protein [Listeria monocytogenes]MDK8260789.1 hypothetical protein [Listeria monocytogenes]
MKQKQLAIPVVWLGYSPACQKALRLLRFCSINEMPKTAFTVYELEKVTGFSHQHLDRCMKKLFADKVVDFRVVNRKGRAAREWFAL